MDRRQLLDAFDRVRGRTMALVAPLDDADWRVQSMPDVSPPYWNLGHTSWFFARNVLAPFGREVGPFPGFDYVFNSYYEGLGPRLPRHGRGAVAAPDNGAVRDYRLAVDAAMRAAIADADAGSWQQLVAATGIGLEHEEQHQELLLTEVLHIRWSTPAPLRRPYAPPPRARGAGGEQPMRPIATPGDVVAIGHQEPGFCWDNELPVHRRVVEPVAVGDRLVTNGEWLEFVRDGGYRDPLLWLSNGWSAVVANGWQAPLYWTERDGRWTRWSLRGEQELEPAAPVAHVSFYEADAFARWYGRQFSAWRQARLPTEFEWEHAARVHGFDRAAANALDDDVLALALEARPAPAGDGVRQLCGDLWEWTQSHYEPYPGYRPFAGALMEYNGKFMDNQRVLRGGSFATPRSSLRVANRNFWPADTRFQAAGVRLLLDG